MLIGSLVMPSPADAATNCPPGSGPIDINVVNDDILCINSDDRSNAGTVIRLQTNSANNYIDLYNSGVLSANAAGFVAGIATYTFGANSPINIMNLGDITASSTGDFAIGFRAETFEANSPLSIVNSGNVAATSNSDFALGFDLTTFETSSPLSVENSGAVSATAFDFAIGFRAETFGVNSPLSIVNSGNVAAVSTNDFALGFDLDAFDMDSPLSVENSGAVTVTAFGFAEGFRASTRGASMEVP